MSILILSLLNKQFVSCQCGHTNCRIVGLFHSCTKQGIGNTSVGKTDVFDPQHVESVSSTSIAEFLSNTTGWESHLYCLTDIFWFGLWIESNIIRSFLDIMIVVHTCIWGSQRYFRQCFRSTVTALRAHHVTLERSRQLFGQVTTLWFSLIPIDATP